MPGFHLFNELTASNMHFRWVNQSAWVISTQTTAIHVEISSPITKLLSHSVAFSHSLPRRLSRV